MSLLESSLVSAGIFADDFADVSITNSIISDNSIMSLNGLGGGIHLTGEAAAVFRNTEIYNNYAGLVGLICSFDPTKLLLICANFPFPYLLLIIN